MINANTYFSGAGLFEIGLLNAGINIVQSFEIDKICCETLRKNFNHEIIETDITKKLVFNEKDSEVMIGTYPCTKYSTAADILKNRTGDDLFLHFFRHIAIKRPEVFIIENVPGMKKFPVVMEALTKIPEYYSKVFCPVHTHNFLPQKRDRLFLIGSRKNFNWSEPISSNQIKLKDIIEKEVNMSIPDYVYRRLNGNYRDKPIISDPDQNDIAPTCVAHYAKDRGTRLVKDKSFKNEVRPYTVKEYARLQGVPDWFRFSGSDSNKYKQIGNGVPTVFGEWVGNELKKYFK